MPFVLHNTALQATFRGLLLSYLLLCGGCILKENLDLRGWWMAVKRLHEGNCINKLSNHTCFVRLVWICNQPVHSCKTLCVIINCHWRKSNDDRKSKRHVIKWQYHAQQQQQRSPHHNPTFWMWNNIVGCPRVSGTKTGPWENDDSFLKVSWRGLMDDFKVCKLNVSLMLD